MAVPNYIHDIDAVLVATFITEIHRRSPNSVFVDTSIVNLSSTIGRCPQTIYNLFDQDMEKVDVYVRDEAEHFDEPVKIQLSTTLLGPAICRSFSNDTLMKIAACSSAESEFLRGYLEPKKVKSYIYFHPRTPTYMILKKCGLRASYYQNKTTLGRPKSALKKMNHELFSLCTYCNTSLLLKLKRYNLFLGQLWAKVRRRRKEGIFVRTLKLLGLKSKDVVWRTFAAAASKAKKGEKGGGASDAPKGSTLSKEIKSTTVVGANTLKDGTDPKILSDYDYPDWLWHLLDKRPALSELRRKNVETLPYEDLKRFVKLDTPAKIKENNSIKAKN